MSFNKRIITIRNNNQTIMIETILSYLYFYILPKRNIINVDGIKYHLITGLKHINSHYTKNYSFSVSCTGNRLIFIK